MKKTELKKIIKENITDWLAERSQNEGDSGYMGYTKKAPKIKMEDQIGEMYYVSRPSKKSTMEELVGKGDVFEFSSLGLTIEDSLVEAGSGSLPEKNIKSIALRFNPVSLSVNKLSSAFRDLDNPVIGYINKNSFFIDLKAVLPSQISTLIKSIAGIPAI